MTRGRTGSSAIIDELNKTSSVRTAQELFLQYDFSKKQKLLKQIYPVLTPFEIWKARGPWLRRRTNELFGQKATINRYLKEVETSKLSEGAKALGFKVLSHHFDQTPLLKPVLKERGYRAIYLKRNLPRQVISGMIAKQRGIYNTKDDYQDTGQYAIDVDEFQKLVRWEQECVERDIELLKSVGFDFIEVSYEEFMSDREGFFGRVLSFLGAPAEVPPASSYTIMIKDLQHTVKNYGDVVESAEAIGMTIV
jgi:LPS sulfotransferase NodH